MVVLVLNATASVRSPCTKRVYARYTSSPDCAMDGKSSSSMELVNCSGAPIRVTSALPLRNDLLVPNGTSLEEKVKLPWVVLTSKLTGLAVAETVTITPFSCIGPTVALGPGGDVRVASFQLLLPVVESAASNRQPSRLVTAAPVAVMEPSQVVGFWSPTPRITRYDADAGDEMVVDASGDTREFNTQIGRAQRLNSSHLGI